MLFKTQKNVPKLLLLLHKCTKNFALCFTEISGAKKNQNERRAEHKNGKPGLRLRLVSRFSPRRVQAARQVGCNPLVLRHVRASSRTLGIDLPGYAHVGELVESILRARYYKRTYRRRVSRSNGQEIFYKYIPKYIWNILKCLGTFKNVMELFKMVRKFQTSSRTFSKGPMEQV